MPLATDVFSTEIHVLTWAPVGILFLPLLACLILVIFGRWLEKAADYFAIGAMSLALALSVLLFAINVRAGGAVHNGLWHSQARPFETSLSWMQIGPVTLTLGFLVDNLSSFMSIVVTGLGTLVLIYSLFYMRGDTLYRRYFAYMCFFCFSMLGIVFSNNLLMTYIFWELVGLGSYFLIGFWFYKPPVAKDPHYQKGKAPYATGIDERYLSPAYAQKKAFVMNRVGDFGFLCGILIFVTVMLAAANGANGYAAKPLNFSSLYRAADAGVFASVRLTIFGFSVSGLTLLTLAGILTFMGAIGKSAQFPLHTWLPDAMQGPTTGSSIIHAATMVAAGVYLTARIHPLLTDGSLFFIAMIGGITAFLAATMAMVQWDIKAVLAYSTISQLGYMMLGLGANAYTAGVSHLFTHAVFKCMLFLCAGSVIVGCHHLQDMNRMGGLRKKMPLTYLATLAGVLAISGVPLFSGFYSKDAILAASGFRALSLGGLHWLPYILGQVTAALTAFYMFRLLFWTFHGEPRDREVYRHVHESPPVATVPLLILATFCLGFWWSGDLNFVLAKLNLSPLQLRAPQLEASGEIVRQSKGWLDALMVSPAAGQQMAFLKMSGREGIEHAEHAHHLAHWIASVCSLLGLLIAGWAAWVLYGAKTKNPDRLIERHPVLRLGYQTASQLWFFDRLYLDGVVPAAKKLNQVIYAFDFGVLDQVLVDGWAYFVRALSRVGGALDDWVVDRFVDACGWATWLLGSLFRSLQAGKIQYYVCVTFGVVAVLLLMLMMV